MKRLQSSTITLRCYVLLSVLVFMASDGFSVPAQTLSATVCGVLLLPFGVLSQVGCLFGRVWGWMCCRDRQSCKWGVSLLYCFWDIWVQYLYKWEKPGMPVRLLSLLSCGKQENFERLFVPLRLNGFKLTALIDSGAETCAISQNLLQKIPQWERLLAQSGRVRLLGANQQ